MHKLLAPLAAALSLTVGALSLGAPAMAQMDNHAMGGPGSTTVTRTVARDDGSRTVVRRTVHRTVHRDDDRDGDRRVVVRRTVVRHTVGNTGWHRHHRHCATRWHHHQRVTRCWTR